MKQSGTTSAGCPMGIALVLALLSGGPAQAAAPSGPPPPSATIRRGEAVITCADAAAAVAAARPGDTVLLGAGTHRGPLLLTNSSVVLRGEAGARVNANSPDWKPRWTPAPSYGSRAYVSPIPFEPGAVSVDDRLMIDVRESRGGLAAHAKGLGEDSRVPLQGLYTYLGRDRALLVSFAADRPPADRRIEASPRGATAVTVRGADQCRVEKLIITGGETGIAFERTRGSVADHCLVYSVDTGVRLGLEASACKVLSCDLTMNPDALSLDCSQMAVGKAVWHAHKNAGTYDKRAVLADRSGESNEVAFNYMYNVWDGVENDTGVGKGEVEDHFKNRVFKGIAPYNRGLRVHHNWIDLAMDDGLEPNDQVVDNQWFANVVTRARCAVRMKTISLGPFYFYDNVVLDSGTGLRLYKTMPACANVYIFNNVIRDRTGIVYLKMDSVCWDDPWLAAQLPRGTPGFRLFNNAFVCNTSFANYDGGVVAPTFVSDHNLFTAPATNAFPPEGSDRHSLFSARPVFADITNGNWRLATNSPGKAAGCALKVFLPALPSGLATAGDVPAPDMGVQDFAGQGAAPRGPVSGLWELAAKSIHLGERDIAQFSLDPAADAPLKPLWGRGVPGTGPLDPKPVMPPPPPKVMPAATPVKVLIGDAPADILRNGSFTNVSEKGTPAGWTLSGGADLALEKADGLSRLTLTVRAVSREQGSLAQALEGIPPGTRLVLTGRIRGSKDKLAFLQVKLKEGKTELKRINSEPCGTAEKAVRLEFSTETATSVSVQCRFSQESAGETVVLSDLKLETVPR